MPANYICALVKDVLLRKGMTWVYVLHDGDAIFVGNHGHKVEGDGEMSSMSLPILREMLADERWEDFERYVLVLTSLLKERWRWAVYPSSADADQNVFKIVSVPNATTQWVLSDSTTTTTSTARWVVNNGATWVDSASGNSGAISTQCKEE